MSFSRRTKYLLIFLLILLNVVIRIPSVPHELGSPDEFTIHVLSNSLSTFGHAKWWIHIPLSIFGLYPYSYGSGSPFIFSGIFQCTDICDELAIWIYCVFAGVFVVLSAYLMAEQIKDDDLFKLLVAFVLSISQGMLTYLTWQTSARGLFFMIVPFFIYILLKSRVSVIKYGFLVGVIFTLLMATHLYFYTLIPLIISLAIILIFNKFNESVNLPKIPNSLVGIGCILGVLVMFSIPFFTGIFIESSRYGQLHSMFNYMIRYTGVFVFYAVGGFIYLSFKNNKTFGEWFLLFACACSAPVSYMKAYGHFITNIFLCVLICIGLTNVIKVGGRKKKYAFAIITICLLFSTAFSGFYQHWRTGAKVHTFYMEESMYQGGVWIGDYVSMDKKLICNDYYGGIRTFSVSKIPTLSVREADFAYGFVNKDEIKVYKRSPWSVGFYKDMPYALIDPHDSDFYRRHIQDVDVSSQAGKALIHKLNVSYEIESIYGVSAKLIRSVHRERDEVYDNGKISVWCLNEC